MLSEPGERIAATKGQPGFCVLSERLGSGGQAETDGEEKKRGVKKCVLGARSEPQSPEGSVEKQNGDGDGG